MGKPEDLPVNYQGLVKPKAARNIYLQVYVPSGFFSWGQRMKAAFLIGKGGIEVKETPSPVIFFMVLIGKVLREWTNSPPLEYPIWDF